MGSPRTTACGASNYPWEKGGTPKDTADRPKSNSIPLIWGVRAPLARGRIKYFQSQQFEEVVMEAVKDASHLYEVERRAMHAERPGFRINEIQISRSQKVPWHYHNNVQDAFYVLRAGSGSSCAIPRRKCASGP